MVTAMLDARAPRRGIKSVDNPDRVRLMDTSVKSAWQCLERDCWQSATFESPYCYFHRKARLDLQPGKQRGQLDDDPNLFDDDGDD